MVRKEGKRETNLCSDLFFWQLRQPIRFRRRDSKFRLQLLLFQRRNSPMSPYRSWQQSQQASTLNKFEDKNLFKVETYPSYHLEHYWRNFVVGDAVVGERRCEHLSTAPKDSPKPHPIAQHLSFRYEEKIFDGFLFSDLLFFRWVGEAVAECDFDCNFAFLLCGTERKGSLETSSTRR